MTEMHERVAQLISNTLDSYLGTSIEVKLETLDQLSIKEHVADLSPRCFVVPFSSNAVFVEFDNELVFPMVELLMGGVGSGWETGRELSEIEEEIMQDVSLLIVRQCEAVWRMPDPPLVEGARIKATLMQQAFAVSEKATVLRFGMECAGVAGGFRVVLAAQLLNALLKKMKQELPLRKSRVHTFAMPPLRERILDCGVEVTAELPGVRVSVRDLIELQAGSVLKLHAPVRNPAMLTSGGCSLFEATPVKSGSLRAAQLGRRVRATEWMKG